LKGYPRIAQDDLSTPSGKAEKRWQHSRRKEVSSGRKEYGGSGKAMTFNSRMAESRDGSKSEMEFL